MPNGSRGVNFKVSSRRGAERHWPEHKSQVDARHAAAVDANPRLALVTTLFALAGAVVFGTPKETVRVEMEMVRAKMVRAIM